MHVFTDTVRYLGHVLQPRTLEVEQSDVRSLREARLPTILKGLQLFLGFCNVYRRFVSGYTEKARPLFDLFKGATKNLPPLTEDQMASFKELIQAVTSPRVFALPKPGLRYSLNIDYSGYGAVCALFQVYPDGRKPIAFWSRKLKEHDLNYSASDLECIAVIFGITTCLHCLLGNRFDLHTNNACLWWMFEINEPSRRLMRWRLRLAGLYYDIKHRKGHLNAQADALSRLFSDGHTTEEEDYKPPVYDLVMLLQNAHQRAHPVQENIQELFTE